METFYFPEEIYFKAHMDYLKKTGKDLEELRAYCLKDQEFFVEVAFSYVDGEPYPKMKELEL